VIYPQDAKQASINVTNSDLHESFLVQSWVSDDKGNKVPAFVVTPPLFVLKPGKVNILRMIYNGPALPEDKESVFYLNNKAIPSLDKTTLTGNSLQIATQSVIKLLFARRTSLLSQSMPLPCCVASQKAQTSLFLIHRLISSPWSIYVAGIKQPNMMVPPKSSQTIKGAGAVKYQTLNDYGAVTAELSCKANCGGHDGYPERKTHVISSALAHFAVGAMIGASLFSGCVLADEYFNPAF
jgi:hypothetical protein